MEFRAHGFQTRGIRRLHNNTHTGLFWGMGSGKTVTVLTWFDQAKFERGTVRNCIVIAPKAVALETWLTEHDKWDHLRHLEVSLIVGTQRERMEGLRRRADVYIVNVDNVGWLIGVLGGYWPFECTVIDESSKFKNPGSNRYKALNRVIHRSKRVIILTGTPAPNGLLDVWAQMYLLDRGKRLGETFGGYRTRYFDLIWQDEHLKHYEPRRGAEAKIHRLIGELCSSMQPEDYLELPGRRDIFHEIKAPKKVQQAYVKFEREHILSLEDKDIYALSQSALTGKLEQYANGFVYENPKSSDWHLVHDLKLDALEDIIDGAEGQPVLVFYKFQADYERLKKRFGFEKLTSSNAGTVVKRWNNGDIPLLAAHPGSAGHGLNMQAGGHIIVWYGLPWDLEYYQQAVKRLERQGQKHRVINHILYCPWTIEKRIRAALEKKDGRQRALLDAVKDLRVKYLTEIKPSNENRFSSVKHSDKPFRNGRNNGKMRDFDRTDTRRREYSW